ncbi:hypothetical protein [Nannocystis radixulma]|uniref:Lipocalin-like domain-containing protein n=1 Tax=Nannocystis radixulma TaxID=2995305 RepID=A0ABT5BFY2_9BACT|nr:hypothetical protein [Nannocystis radixulma]MDC0673052.1 hypothetical protein [Nannocystis radixulma]
MTNPRWMQAARGAIALGLGLIACADDSAMDASGETSGTTTTGTGSESGGESGKTDTTGDDVDPFEPWYGTWYWVDPRFTINETISTQNGAHGLGMNQVDFAPGTFTIREEYCTWGTSKYEYASRVDEMGVLVLDPVDPANQPFESEYKKLFVVAGPDCAELRLKGVRLDDEEVELLTYKSGPLRRASCASSAQKERTSGGSCPIAARPCRGLARNDELSAAPASRRLFAFGLTTRRCRRRRP